MRGKDVERILPYPLEREVETMAEADYSDSLDDTAEQTNGVETHKGADH